jgi:isopentenyldiphosphate isomerase/intracellular septation protein A
VKNPQCAPVISVVKKDFPTFADLFFIMNISLFKKLLPGLIPLFIFIIADEIWGTKVGLYVAIGCGLGELIFYYGKDRKIDRFILLDTSLLLIMGIIYLALENDIFFKIKPALIEVILLIIVAFSIWGPKNLVMAMSKRYMGEMELNAGQEKMMRINMKVMFWITAIHILLVLYSAKYMSDEAWAFISGGLFYIFFGAYFLLLWIINRTKNRKLAKEEWFPVVDEEGRVIGKAPRSVCHDGKSKFLHPVVHLLLFNKNRKLFLQLRSKRKDIQPGKWDTSVGGHVVPGETIEKALMRETQEETGLKNIQPQFLHKYIWESDAERELVFSFISVSDEIPEIDISETDEGRFWSMDEISDNLGKNIFTPNFEHEYNLLKQKHNVL